MERWYKIDNTGKIFHAVSNASNSSVYRVAMIMEEPVEPSTLQKALDKVIKRFPMLAVKVRKGFFWDFMEDNDEQLFIQKETTYPCSPINPKDNSGYLIRVLYFQHRISVEIYHSLTDGAGAIEFLKSLIFQYLHHQGKAVTADDHVLYPDDVPSKYESEDSFEKYFQKTSQPKPREKAETAFQIKGTSFDPPGINVIHGVMQASEVNQFAKQIGGSTTEFITAVLIHAIYAETMKYGLYNESIMIALPADLRHRFPSVTLRNFFSVINVGMPVNDETTLQDIMKTISEQLNKKTEKGMLQTKINRHVQFQKKLAAKLVPIFLKHHAMRYGFHHFGEMSKTMTLSNLGNIQIPESMRPFTKRMEIVFYPTKNSPINCGICSLNDRLTITFARSIMETEIIKSFFNQLTRLTGLDIEVYSNDWGEAK